MQKAHCIECQELMTIQSATVFLLLSTITQAELQTFKLFMQYFLLAAILRGSEELPWSGHTNPGLYHMRQLNVP